MIATHLNMEAEFHPALHLEDEKYGDAVLTALPMRLIKAAPLPSSGEPRGALWVEIDVAEVKLQVIVTHLGLRGAERLRQATALLGPGWLGGMAQGTLTWSWQAISTPRGVRPPTGSWPDSSATRNC